MIRKRRKVELSARKKKVKKRTERRRLAFLGGRDYEQHTETAGVIGAVVEVAAKLEFGAYENPFALALSCDR